MEEGSERHQHEETIVEDGDIVSADKTGSIARLLLVDKPECFDYIGFNLTRSQWDPYPWVKSVDQKSPAEKSGLREGDCLLRVNDEDLLGRKVCDVARLVKSAASASSSNAPMTLSVWSTPSSGWDPEALVGGPLPDALRRLTKVVSATLAALECPICCSTVRPPAASCPRGHLFCAPCRRALTSCPLCRVPLPPVGAAGASGPAPLRNLLADEVYNCVVEAFELSGEKAQGKLTDSLFGSAKITKNDSTKSNGVRSNGMSISSDAEFVPHDVNGRGLKWGTQKLLQRLLPGRARSIDNIARVTTSNNRDGPYTEERDLSRSLSNLDMTRCTQSMNSLTCTAGGSCASLPPSGYLSRDERFAEMDIRSKNVTFFCPVDQHCQEKIRGNLHEHILKSHNTNVILNATDTINIENCSETVCTAVYHSSGSWFYPKCERDHSNDGILIWCWSDGSNAVSSRFQLLVEMWVDVQGNSENLRRRGNFTEPCRMKKRNLSLVDEMPENLLRHFENISNDQANHVEQTNNVEDLPVKIIEEVNKKQNDIQQAKPMLKFTCPIISLQNISWANVISSNLALYLGDSLISNNHKIKITIDVK